MKVLEVEGMKIESNLPSVVKEFTYARNCHYLKLLDDQGESVTLVEQGLIKYACKSCKFHFYAESNQANFCPVCSKPGIESRWMKPQVALVPDKESKFKMPKKDEE